MIREASNQDVKQIIEVGETFQANFSRIYNLKNLLKEPYFHILVYEEKKQIKGILIYTNLYEVVDILDIIVLKEYRKQKIATNLMDYLITSLNTFDKVYLEVSTDNLIAIKLYQKFGFKVIDTRKEYYDTTDAYVMERIIK